MAFQCDIPCIACPPSFLGIPNDPGNPYLNLSSEAPDVDNFIGRSYTTGSPPLGQLFYAVGCIGWCVASTQEEADLCAARQAQICLGIYWPVTGINPGFNPSLPESPSNPRTTSSSRANYGNTPQTCVVDCNGTSATFTTPANTFFAFNQLTANTSAYNYACSKAISVEICLSDLSNSRVCYMAASAVTLSCLNSPSGTFSLISGSLPPGMTLSDTGSFTGQISGTATTAGTYNFTIRFTEDVTNFTGDKAFSLEVFGISNSSPLTAGINGTPYSNTLTLTGTPTGNWDFTVTSGSLPTGLTLNSVTGIISGTPTVNGTYAFTIQVQDAM